MTSQTVFFGRGPRRSGGGPGGGSGGVRGPSGSPGLAGLISAAPLCMLLIATGLVYGVAWEIDRAATAPFIGVVAIFPSTVVAPFFGEGALALAAKSLAFPVARIGFVNALIGALVLFVAAAPLERAIGLARFFKLYAAAALLSVGVYLLVVVAKAFSRETPLAEEDAIAIADPLIGIWCVLAATIAVRVALQQGAAAAWKGWGVAILIAGAMAYLDAVGAAAQLVGGFLAGALLAPSLRAHLLQRFDPSIF